MARSASWRNRVTLASSITGAAATWGQHAPVIHRRCSTPCRQVTANRNGARGQRAASGALLLGRIFDDRGNRMTPSTAKKGAIRYRYYLSSVLAQGRTSEAGSARRASPRRLKPCSTPAEHCIRRTPISTRDADPDLGRRIVVRAGIDIRRIGPASADRCALVTEAATQPACDPPAARTATDFERGIKAEARTVLLRSIAPVADGGMRFCADRPWTRSRSARAARRVTSPRPSPRLPGARSRSGADRGAPAGLQHEAHRRA